MRTMRLDDLLTCAKVSLPFLVGYLMVLFAAIQFAADYPAPANWLAFGTLAAHPTGGLLVLAASISIGMLLLMAVGGTLFCVPLAAARLAWRSLHRQPIMVRDAAIIGIAATAELAFFVSAYSVRSVLFDALDLMMLAGVVAAGIRVIRSLQKENENVSA